MAIEDELFQIVKDVNHAWLESDWSVMYEYFHDDVVMSMPGLQQQVIGRAVLVQSYKDFVANATIDQFQEDNPVVNSWGRVAMITYDFSIEYTESGRHSKESGTEMFLFLQEK